MGDTGHVPLPLTQNTCFSKMLLNHLQGSPLPTELWPLYVLQYELAFQPGSSGWLHCCSSKWQPGMWYHTIVVVSQTSPSMLPPIQNYACHNHIRVYQQFPGQDLLFVCGSNAAGDPLCRTVELQDGELGTAYSTIIASNGLVSYFPELSGFGEFRNGI